MYGVKFFFAKLILAWRERAAIRGTDLSRHIQTLKSQGQAFLSPAKDKKSNPNRRTAAQARGQRLMIGDHRSTKDFWTGPASVKIQARRTAGGGLVQMRPFLALT